MRALTFSAILRDGTLELEPGFVTEGEPSHEKGELTVEALGPRERPLATTAVPLAVPCTPRVGQTIQTALGLVAFPEKTVGLRVRLRGEVVAERTAPRRAPEVTVDWPASLSGPETVRWQASAEECFAALGYSNDGGETWTPLALPGPDAAIAVDASALPGGRECLLELIVTDGFHTQHIRSEAYRVEPKGWVLWILAPARGARLPAGQPVLLAAQGYHLEERRAGFDDIEWESSAGGGLGTGARVLAALEPGEHRITARMYDAMAEVVVTAG